jgi:hypothetical protein
VAKAMKHRPFRLSDAILLVIAVAVGLWRNRVVWYSAFPWTKVKLHFSVEYALILVMPLVAATTVAVVAMQMVKPRPSFRRLGRQPGAVACLVASAALLLIALWFATTMITGRALEFSQNVTRLSNGGVRASAGVLKFRDTGRWLNVYGDRVGFTVAGAWLYLSLAGLWRSEATWIDRLGRAMGWLWISLAVALWSRALLLCTGVSITCNN